MFVLPLPSSNQFQYSHPNIAAKRFPVLPPVPPPLFYNSPHRGYAIVIGLSNSAFPELRPGRVGLNL